MILTAIQLLQYYNINAIIDEEVAMFKQSSVMIDNTNAIILGIINTTKPITTQFQPYQTPPI